jgi:hypothetical protein
MVRPRNEAYITTQPRIGRDPDIALDKPAVKGARISVEFSLDLSTGTRVCTRDRLIGGTVGSNYVI